MSKQCALTGKKAQFGHKVSHSQRKSCRRFNPNIQDVSLRSDILDKSFKLKVAASTLRSIDHNGGLDNFLLTATSSKLGEEGRKLRSLIKKKQEQLA